MPWKGLRPDPAGGRRSRRQSFLDEGGPSALDNNLRSDHVDPKSQSLEASKLQSTSRPSSRNTSPGPASIAQATTNTDYNRSDMPQQLKRKDTAKIPKSHRFSLLRFRHASDPQLSRSYATSATTLTPPMPNPPSECSMLYTPKILLVWTADSGFLAYSPHHHHYRT